MVRSIDRNLDPEKYIDLINLKLGCLSRSKISVLLQELSLESLKWVLFLFTILATASQVWRPRSSQFIAIIQPSGSDRLQKNQLAASFKEMARLIGMKSWKDFVVHYEVFIVKKLLMLLYLWLFNFLLLVEEPNCLSKSYQLIAWRLVEDSAFAGCPNHVNFSIEF